MLRAEGIRALAGIAAIEPYCEEEVARAVAWAVDAGATLADFQPQEDVRVLFDPAGHAFCLYLG